jgi:hypothetical protein
LKGGVGEGSFRAGIVREGIERKRLVQIGVSEKE